MNNELKKIEQKAKFTFLTWFMKVPLIQSGTIGGLLITLLIFGAWSIIPAPEEGVLLARDTIFVTQVDTVTKIKNKMKIVYVDKQFSKSTKETPEPVKYTGKDESWKDKKDNLYDLMIKVQKRSSLTNWEKFRYEVYQTSIRIKNMFPKLPMNHRTIYECSMKLMWHESGYDPNAKNSKGSAEGLFQAISSTKKTLGIKGDFTRMNEFEQLKYYEKYIILHLRNVDVTQIKDLTDWYYLGLYPAHADKPDWTLFASKWGNKEMRQNYRYNSGLDLNKDGKITKGEVGQKMAKIWK